MKLQGPQVLLAVQMGFGLAQLALVRQATQLCAPETSQIGVVPEQLLLLRHCTHTRLAVRHCEVGALHWVLEVHCTHWPPLTLVSQTGVVPEQPDVAVQVTQLLVLVLQSGVVGKLVAQVAFEVHCTHWPPLTLVSQVGVVPEQPDVAVQVTQLLVLVLQTGVEGKLVAHVAFDVHCTHWPPLTLVSQVGVLPEQPVVAVQRTQLRVAASQTGVEGELLAQVVLLKQPTHWPPLTLVSHTGVAPEQPLVAVQRTHDLVAESQAGVAPEQSVLLRHPTH